MNEQLLNIDELKSLCNNSNLSVICCNSISTNISLTDISYKEFIDLAQQNNSNIFIINIIFDHSEIELLDTTALSLIPTDVLEDIKKYNNTVMKTKLAYIKDGLVFSVQYINDDLVELDEQVKDIYKQLDEIINKMNRQTLKLTLLQDNSFGLQSSQTKRSMYVKENYKELLDECKLVGSELTYFLDSIYQELKKK